MDFISHYGLLGTALPATSNFMEYAILVYGHKNRDMARCHIPVFASYAVIYGLAGGCGLERE